MYSAQDWNLLLTTLAGFLLSFAAIIARSKCFNAVRSQDDSPAPARPPAQGSPDQEEVCQEASPRARSP
jgi:hypothetical protein